MKTLILSLIILIPGLSFAGQQCQTDTSAEIVEGTVEIKTDVPKHLEGATIIVRLKDGTESKVPAEKFKVVPRKQQFLVAKTKQSTVTTCSNNESRKNRVSLLGGKGRSKGLDVSKSGNTVTVEEKFDLVGGLQYQYMFTDRWSVGGQLQTNETGLLNLGYDF